jgi:phage head maturation protease
MSFGFKVAEDKREVVEDHERNKTVVTRTITKISKLYDVSAVSLPANDATSISARSFGAGVVDELVQELRKRDEQKKRIRILSMM